MGFEPTNGGFADQSWISILLVRLAFTPAYLADFGPYLGLIVPKLFPTWWGEPLRWHKLFGHTCSLKTRRDAIGQREKTRDDDPRARSSG